MTYHDGLAQEVLDFLTQIGVGSLCVLLRIKRHIPIVVVCKLTAHKRWTQLTAEQVLHILHSKQADTEAGVLVSRLYRVGVRRSCGSHTRAYMRYRDHNRVRVLDRL